MTLPRIKNSQDLSQYLKILRGDLPIRRLSIITKISIAYLSQLESGKRKKPHPEILQKLADFYFIPVLELFRRAGYFREGEIERYLRFKKWMGNK